MSVNDENERIRFRLQSRLSDAKRNVSRYRNADYSAGSGARRLDKAIKGIEGRIDYLRSTWSDSDEPQLYSGEMDMTELDKYDTNGNGVIDPHELAVIELEDRRRQMEDEDAQRDSIRKMAWFALFGLLLYPFGIFLCDLFGLDTAAGLIADIAPTYFASIAVLVSAFFGASAIKKKAG